MAIPNFIHSLVEHLSCFHFLDVMNYTAMNIHLEAFVWTYVLNSLGYIFRNGIAASFWGTARLFPTMPAPLYIHTSNAEGFNFSTYLPMLVIIFHYNCFFMKLFQFSFLVTTILACFLAGPGPPLPWDTWDYYVLNLCFGLSFPSKSNHPICYSTIILLCLYINLINSFY